MIRTLVFVFGALTSAVVMGGVSLAQMPEPTESPAPAETAAPATQVTEQAAPKQAVQAPATPEAEAVSNALNALAPGNTDEERNERAALISFYETRAFAPLWLTSTGSATPKAVTIAGEIKRADEWGLEPRDFPLPSVLDKRETENAAAAAPDKIAAAEIQISQAVLKYGRFARGGRIINPSEQLSSYLDRRPQLIKPQLILEGIAAAGEPGAYLRGLNPPQPQFEKLRQKYLAVLNRGRQPNAEARKLLANMEEWRWMPLDMGSIYIWNNIPDFTQRVVKDGKIVRNVHIVAGEVSKQTPIFTRGLRKITFKPTWIVPDSIKVRELLPSLQRGGGLMRKWALEVRSKDGKPMDWRRIDWSTTDIREVDVIQPNGPQSVMGKVKFSFPNQHTVFMHDTLPRDKFMFNSVQRTYSHGCMRVADPIGLAQIVLREDKGWDQARVLSEVNTGPLNNEIALDRRVPVHMTYFTALVDEDGKLHTFPDVYGHERRITLALEGKWSQIVKGRDHLAPVELVMASEHRRHRGDDDDAGDAPRRRRYDDEAADLAGWRRREHASGGGFLSSLFGDGGY